MKAKPKDRPRRKGFVLDIIVVVIIMFVFGFAILITDKIMTGIETALPDNSTTINKTIFVEVHNTMSIFDEVFVFATIGFFITTLISAFMIDAHPAFFIFSLIMLIILIVIGTQLTNVWLAIASSPQMSDISSKYPMMTTIFQHLPLIMLIFGFLVIIVLVARPRGVTSA